MRAIQQETGFTLMELTVSSVVMGIIAVVAFTIVYNQTTTFNKMFNHTVAMGDARKAVKLMRTDFRNLSGEKIIKMTNDHFKFLDENNKPIDYQYAGNQIERNKSSILSGVKKAPFSYLNALQKKTTKKDSVKFIQVNLLVVSDKESYELQETIYARN